MTISRLKAQDRDFTGYRMPTGGFIARGRVTEKLYRLEEKAADAIKASAVELHRLSTTPTVKTVDAVAVRSTSTYWKLAMPETIFSVLDSFQTECAILAAIAFLRKEGIEIDASTLKGIV